MKNITEEIAALTQRFKNLQPREEPEVSEVQRELEARQERKERLLSANYPLRAVENLSNLRGPGFSKAQELATHIVKPKADAMVLLIGDRGRGKTQIATYLASERIRAGSGCGRYIKAFDLLGEIKASWSAKNTEENDILQKYKKVLFLVVDEFQERSESEWDNRTLTNILDHRYDRKLATVIIANIAAADLKNHVPRSILSRCQETGGIINCNWGSYREGNL